MTESLFEFRISLQRFRDVQYGLNSDLQVRRLNSFMHKIKTFSVKDVVSKQGQDL